MFNVSPRRATNNERALNKCAQMAKLLARRQAIAPPLVASRVGVGAACARERARRSAGYQSAAAQGGASSAQLFPLPSGRSDGAPHLTRAEAQLAAQRGRHVAIFGYESLTTFGCESLTTSGKHFPTAPKNLCHFWLRILNHVFGGLRHFWLGNHNHLLRSLRHFWLRILNHLVGRPPPFLVGKS